MLDFVRQLLVLSAQATLAQGWADLQGCPWGLTATVHGRTSCPRGCRLLADGFFARERGPRFGENQHQVFTVTFGTLASLQGEVLLHSQGAVPRLHLKTPMMKSPPSPFSVHVDREVAL